MSSPMVFVKPGPYPVVLMPERANRRLPAEGALVPLDSYWQRRIEDGDVIVAEQPGAASIDASAKPKAKPSA